MTEIYKYLYTEISIFGSLPTYKVFISSTNNKTIWVFADDTFIYGNISDWSLRHARLDSGKSSWTEEPKLILENEKRKLILYRVSHLEFKTEVVIK